MLLLLEWKRFQPNPTPPVTAQDSSPPSVVRKGFCAAGMAAAGCHARSTKRREPPQAARNQAPE